MYKISKIKARMSQTSQKFAMLLDICWLQASLDYITWVICSKRLRAILVPTLKVSKYISIIAKVNYKNVDV